MRHEYIWGAMYNGLPSKDNNIIQIKLSKCDYYDDWFGKGPTYCFVWGYPGPDYTLYHWRDFGKTWAYELTQFNIPNVEQYVYKENL